MRYLPKNCFNFAFSRQKFSGGVVQKLVSSFLIFFILLLNSSHAKIHILDWFSQSGRTSVDFLVFDSLNNIQENLQKNNFQIFENAIPVNNFTYTSIQSPSNDNQSILFLVDLSIGNIIGTEINKSFAKNVIVTFCNFFPNDEKALIGFNYENFLLCNFTNNNSKLISSLTYLQTKEGSNFDTAFLASNLGALNFISNAKFNKNIVLVVDKNRNIDIERIAQIASNKLTKIFVLMINNTISEELKILTRRTNGAYFELQNTSDTILLMKTFEFIIRNGRTSTLSWDNLPLCNPLRNIELTYNNFDTVSFNIELTSFIYPQLISSPPYLRFSSVVPGIFRDLDIYIIARNMDVKIDSFKLNDPHFQIAQGNLSASITLPKDSGYKLTIRFTPTDSSIVFDSLIIYSNACSIKKINITGGFPNKKPRERTLKLLSPKCNDYYFIGDTLAIRWEGLLPADVVQLQYSTNNGETWDTLAYNVLGLEYRWWLNPAKFQQSDSCLIRIIQIWPNNAGETIEFRHISSVNSANFNRDASLIVTAANHPKDFASVWHPGTGKKMFSLIGHRKQVNWACFDNQDRYILTASDDSTAILWDVKTGDSLFTFTGHNGKVTSANFSPEGNYIVTSGIDGKLFIWNLTTKSIIQTLSTGIFPIYFASFLNDSNLVAYASYDGNIYVYNIEKQKIIKTFSTTFSNNHIHHFSFHPSVNCLAAASHLGLIFIWDFDISDTINSKITPRYILAHDTISYPAINTVYFNSNGVWLITSGSDSRILRWNPSTGELIDSIAIGEHSNSVTTAMFSFDDAMLLTSSWDSTAKIFNRTKLGLQIDTTDCPFSINTPNVISFDQNIGKVALGKSIDTLLKPILINNSRFPISIRKIELLGANSLDFKILAITPQNFILPGDTIQAQINFAPSDTGSRVAKMKIYFEGNFKEINLIGYGYISPLSIKPNFIDLGEVDFGEYKDTLLSSSIKNISPKTVIINSVRNIGPDSLNFAIIDGGETDTLQPLAFHPLTIRFTPDTTGQRNTIIQVTSNSDPPNAYLQITGTGIFPKYDSITIAVGNFQAEPGEIIKIPIVIRKKYFINKSSEYKGFGFDLTFNKTILQPLDTQFKSVITYNNRTLKVLAYSENILDSTLITLSFKVGLGNDTISPLTLSNSYPLGKGKIVIKEESGSFKLVGLCNQGGVRLFEPEGKISFNSIQPNPSNGLLFLDFEIAEVGKTKIEIFDYTGVLQKTLLDQKLHPGEYQFIFDVSDLPNGPYLIVLKTANQTLSKIFQLTQ